MSVADVAKAPRPPSVERVLSVLRPLAGGDVDPTAVLTAARAVVDEQRLALAGGAAAADPVTLAERAFARLAPASTGPTPVINATGVIVHTNLGRAPWPRAAIEAARAAAAAPLFLELDRASGRRGRRYRSAEELLIVLTGAEDALITNNNAAALALAVGLAGRGGVAVSRGELVEIGGGVRIPEIVRRAGARLVEVGTTNRTRAEDFAAVLADGRARLVLRVHPSNFRIEGFTEAPDPGAVAAAAHEYGALVVDDLGSGALLETAQYGLAHEPMPSERLAAGADLVTFSGDKLLGGPQAGLIIGRGDLVARLRRDPLARAVRPDKVTLAALAATLELYRVGRATTEIPVWRMIAARPSDLETRAAAVATEVADDRVSVTELESTVGGGSLPGELLESFGLVIRGRSPERLLERLRLGDPAAVGRVAFGAVLLDLRTVAPDEDAGLARAVRGALGAR
jgi:L-seryl-tRNA(Ser) seleniumtransferase